MFDNFSCDVFDDVKIKRYLGKKALKEMQKTKFGETISKKTAEKYAKGVRKWALGRKAYRFTHRFLPMNNCVAGKRDSLVSIDKKGRAVVKFRGKELKNGEGDASSFPSGGMRQTFEARGITQWDSSSQAFLRDGCLAIPTTFSGTNGEVLDKKTPLLRSCAALNREAMRLLRLLNVRCNGVFAVVGAEQEYFLVDKQTFLARQDLLYTGRTLLGCLPPKNTQLSSHYLRQPNAKILQFWQEVDTQLARLGIVVKTEHREVAPSQFELAPCYASVNVACDQNQIVMETLVNVADKFDLVCLLHEKPFDKLNGSGKHNNWSLLTDTDVNLFEMGNTPQEQARFVLFLASVIRAVDLHSDLLAFSTSSAANDCRLGGYEAPPKIISMFLGDIFPAICQALKDENWQLGRDALPQTQKSTDRNRTSPFAFTGNKFEFRAVGSSASLADANTVLNIITADSLKFIADSLQGSKDFWTDAKTLVKQIFAQHGKIVFNGNNYSPSWLDEAKKLGLHCASNTPQAISCLQEEKNVALFAKFEIFSPREIAALQQIALENYVGALKIEVATLVETCNKQIVPAVEKYVGALLQIATNKQLLQLNAKMEISAIKKASAQNRKLLWHTCKLKKYLQQCNALTLCEQAELFCNTVIPQMHRVRQIADNLEELCPKEYWPMPTYADLLFGTSLGCST